MFISCIVVLLAKAIQIKIFPNTQHFFQLQTFHLLFHTQTGNVLEKNRILQVLKFVRKMIKKNTLQVFSGESQKYACT